MNPPTIFAANDTRPHLPPATVLISIFGFWLFYVAIVTLRASVMDWPAQGELALRRIYVTGAGMVLTIAVWQFMWLFDNRRLAHRIIAAAFACIPAAIAISLANYYIFNVYDQASLMDIEKLRSAGGKPPFWIEISEVAVSRYFFLIAWSALYLALSFAQEVRFAERRAAMFERAAQLSELRALRYQLNPHFLFNTLNSLSALVMSGRHGEAESMIMNLATFYRTSLTGDPSGDVTLAEEIEVQRLYLDIETVRFSDRLKIGIDLPPDLENVAVPGLILQPLVENAIKHGVARTAQPVTLKIAASASKERLTITVSDNAPAAAVANEPGIGLANVRDRLIARFGDAAANTVGPDNQGSGFVATLTLPLIRHD